MSKTVKELSDQLNTLAVQHEQLLQRNKLLEMALGSTPVDQRSQPGSVELQREVPAVLLLSAAGSLQAGMPRKMLLGTVVKLWGH